MRCKHCFKKAGAPMHADYRYRIIDATPYPVLVINDLNLGNRSVTNGIECVLAQIRNEVPNIGKHRVIYSDSEGIFDEVIIDNSGNFLAFHPVMPGERHTDLGEALKSLGVYF